MRKLVLLLLILVGLMAPVVVAQDGAVVVEPGDPVVLGLASIRSGEGLVPLGDDIVRGVELAIAARPFVTIDGEEFEIELDIQDDQCSAEGGQAIANYFASITEIVAVVGPTCSSACRAAGPIFDQAGYSMISSSCTAVDLTAPSTGFASFNRTTPNDDGQGVQAASFIYNVLGARTIATIHDGSPYGEGLVNVVTDAFEALGGTVAVADAVTVGETNFRTLLNTVASAGVDLIYFGGFPAEAARLAEQRADVGLDDTAFMGADGIFSPEFVNLAGAAAEGVYVSTPSPADSTALEEFIAEYVAVYGLEPTAAFHSYAYDAANIVLDAIEAVGTIDDDGNLVINRAELAAAIRSFGADEPVVGLSGVLSCDGTGECAQGGIGFFQITDGVFERIEMEMDMDDDMMMMPTLDIASIAMSDSQFSTLVAAVLAADPSFVAIATGPGPITVFAPTNDAFAAALEALGISAGDLLGNTELLTAILSYHVVEGAVLSSDLSDGLTVPTALGAELTFTVNEMGVMVNNANVIMADIIATNGVIHVINAVLLPPSE